MLGDAVANPKRANQSMHRTSGQGNTQIEGLFRSYLFLSNLEKKVQIITQTTEIERTKLQATKQTTTPAQLLQLKQLSLDRLLQERALRPTAQNRIRKERSAFHTALDTSTQKTDSFAS